MKSAVVCGFNEQQAMVFKKLLKSYSFEVGVITQIKSLDSDDIFKKYEILILNLDEKKLRDPHLYEFLDTERQLLLGICSPKIFRILGDSFTNRFFDIMKKPISSVELKKKIDEVIQVYNLIELNRVSSNLLESFDEVVSLYSLDDPYKVIEQLLDLLSRKLDAKGGIVWLKGIESSENFILAGARGKIELKNEPSTYGVEEISNKNYPPNQLVKVESNTGGKTRPLMGVLDFQGETIGLIKMFFSSESIESLRAKLALPLLKIGASALFNASKLEQVRRSHLIDTHTRIYNVSFFRDYLDKEIQKSKRFRRPLSLLLLVLENFHELKREVKIEELNGAIEKIIYEVNGIVRSSDILCKIRDDKYGVILSETDYYGAIMLKKRIIRKFWETSSFKVGNKGKLKIMISEASYPRDGLDYGSIVDVAERRLEENRTSLYAQLNLETDNFWECLDEIYQNIKTLNTKEKFDYKYNTLMVPEKFILSLKSLFFNEVYLNKESKGVIYLGCEGVNKDDPFVSKNNLLNSSNSVVYLITSSQLNKKKSSGSLIPICVQDNALKSSEFLIYIGELGFYCIFLKRKNKKWMGFHSIDSFLVENLASKLEELYAFEREFLI